jgi:hypothetical protein
MALQLVTKLVGRKSVSRFGRKGDSEICVRKSDSRMFGRKRDSRMLGRTTNGRLRVRKSGGGISVRNSDSRIRGRKSNRRDRMRKSITRTRWLKRFSAVWCHTMNLPFRIFGAFLSVTAQRLGDVVARFGTYEDRRCISGTYTDTRCAKIREEEVGELDTASLTTIGGASFIADASCGWVVGCGTVGTGDPLLVRGTLFDVVDFAAARIGFTCTLSVVRHNRSTDAAVLRLPIECALLGLAAVLDLLPVSTVAAHLESGGGGAVVVIAAMGVGYGTLLEVDDERMAVSAAVCHVGLSKAISCLGAFFGRLPVTMSLTCFESVSVAAADVSYRALLVTTK